VNGKKDFLDGDGTKDDADGACSARGCDPDGGDGSAAGRVFNGNRRGHAGGGCVPRHPAAGICASVEGPTVRVEIFDRPDGVPQPRCIAVRADQTLVLINRAPERIEFALGRFRSTVEPGGSFAIDLPFGSFLAPGVHSLHIAPHGGPEIVLR
jgi:hypothetical protein